ncbi:MAG: hypothetical protein UW21_C0027G0011 [Candidatus Woesebacteria bacterium GW2011_GWB1_44_11b]|uniref:Uncharacterized protein n=1 Tax=Candidatus Woesebacteria bacterium GW2011_GWB1_44_11b TaxID=1618580 RepID=A0A0G1JA73_9BACT|nr:MAG: hypothetical protein UW21_C0027G0011 [Candidatus Woesebacteria bacterium GW2011_GWB1_44_11b]
MPQIHYRKDTERTIHRVKKGKSFRSSVGRRCHKSGSGRLYSGNWGRCQGAQAIYLSSRVGEAQSREKI